MKLMTSLATALGFAASCCVAYPAAAAGKYDGSAALICAVLVVHECAVEETCQPRTAESVGLPALLRVDVKAKQLRNLDTAKPRETPIKNVEHVNNRLVLYGGEAGRGWAVSIQEDTGKMSASVSADELGFVIFGQCALP